MNEEVERLPEYVEAAAAISSDALRAALAAARDKRLDPAKLIHLIGTELTMVLSALTEPDGWGWASYEAPGVEPIEP